jgi:hypothetical protein
VTVRGISAQCPLCSNTLQPDEAGTQGRIFPVVPPRFERNMAYRIMLFASITIIVCSIAVYLLFPSRVNWPFFVVLGILSMWASFITIVRKMHNITKTIMWQVFVVSVLAVIWDWRTGWLDWSLEYLIPILNVSAVIVMYVTAKAMKLGARDYIAYFLLGGLFGIIPVLFIAFGLIKVIFPSIISVAGSVIFIAAIVIFHGDNIMSELQRKMHI